MKFARRPFFQWQLVRFGMVGAATYVLAIAVFHVLQYLFPDHRLASATVSYLVGIAAHFSANKVFTFGNRDQILRRQVLRYLVVSLINYLIAMCCLEGLVRRLHIPATLAFGLSVATTTALGYVTLRFWVFAKR